jgi:hypothetical protein
VAVGLGIKIVGTAVGGGNGFTEESGFTKMVNTMIATTTAAINTVMERISHIFVFIVFPPKIF